jgi:hypothetical protein
MTFNFVDKINDDLKLQPILISGHDSLKLNEEEYLILVQTGNERVCFKIMYECHFSPFKEATIIENLLAVGHEAFFYLFDLKTKMNILRLEMDGYFGHLYSDNELFYVTDACGVYCIDKNASILWQNKNLGIDGVLIHDFKIENIFGSGEWDPPGGWIDFILHKQTGKMKK